MTEWQPIETAPKDGSLILSWDNPYMIVVSWDTDPRDEGGQCWKINYSGDWMTPTHWMPLPAPPKKGDE
jgi:hypothetical protein